MAAPPEACAASRTSRRKACGVCTARSDAAVGRPDHDAPVVDQLDGVGHRQPGDDGAVPGAHVGHEPAEERGRARRRGRRRARGRCRRRRAARASPAATESVRSAPPATTRTTASRRGPGRDRARLHEVGGGRDDDDVGDLRGTGRTLDRVLEQRRTGHGHEGLGLGGAEPRARGHRRRGRRRRVRRRGPRRGWPRPCPRWSSRRARARRRGSGVPWRACASRRRTGHGPCHGATGRGRPRPP